MRRLVFSQLNKAVSYARYCFQQLLLRSSSTSRRSGRYMVANGLIYLGTKTAKSMITYQASLKRYHFKVFYQSIKCYCQPSTFLIILSFVKFCTSQFLWCYHHTQLSTTVSAKQGGLLKLDAAEIVWLSRNP